VKIQENHLIFQSLIYFQSGSSVVIRIINEFFKSERVQNSIIITQKISFLCFIWGQIIIEYLIDFIYFLHEKNTFTRCSCFISVHLFEI